MVGNHNAEIVAAAAATASTTVALSPVPSVRETYGETTDISAMKLWLPMTFFL